MFAGTHLISSNQKGFSLTEIMIALTIVALAGGAVAVGVMNQFAKSKVDLARVEIRGFVGALDAFYRDCSRYPTTEEGLQVLVQKPENCKNWMPGGYLNKTSIPKDPWQNDYVYRNAGGRKFEILSYGEDGVEGGADNAADISSKNLDS